MALIKCKECKKNISDNVDRCPNCGALTECGEKMRKKQKKILIIVSVIIALIVFFKSIFPIIVKKINEHENMINVFGKWRYSNYHYLEDYTYVMETTYDFKTDGTCTRISYWYAEDYATTYTKRVEPHLSEADCTYKINDKNNRIKIAYDFLNENLDSIEWSKFNHRGSYLYFEDDSGKLNEYEKVDWLDRKKMYQNIASIIGYIYLSGYMEEIECVVEITYEPY